MPNEVTKNSRVRLSDEERELRRVAKIKRDNECEKARGYPKQKRYRENHKGEIYEPKVRIPSRNKHILEELQQKTGLTITQLFLGSLKDKYGVDLSK